MWKSADGTAHTVALPDPAAAMSDEFVQSLNALGPDEREVIRDATDNFYDNLEALLDPLDPSESTSPEEDALPDSYLRGTFDSGSALCEYLDTVEIAWRLDAFLAVGDLLDELEEAVA